MRYVLLKRPSRKKWNKKQILSGRRPIRRGIVSRARDDVTTKKPHSAKRKVAAFYIQNKKYLKNRAYMPGEDVKGQLKKYDTIFFNGNRRRDVPALKYTIIYGVHTKRGQMSTRVTGINYRRKARSKYGVKRFLLEPEKAAAAAGIIAGDVPAREERGNDSVKNYAAAGEEEDDGGPDSGLEVIVRGRYGRSWEAEDVVASRSSSHSQNQEDSSEDSEWQRWDPVERLWQRQVQANRARKATSGKKGADSRGKHGVPKRRGAK